MTSVTTKPDSSQPTGETAVYLFDNWFDPIEGGLRDRVREFIHAMIEGELDMALSRPRYARHAKSPSGEAEETVGVTGHRHGHRSRSLMGSFGRVEIEVPRARLNTADGKTTEWKSKALRAYQRRTLVVDALEENRAQAPVVGPNFPPGPLLHCASKLAGAFYVKCCLAVIDFAKVVRPELQPCALATPRAGA